MAINNINNECENRKTTKYGVSHKVNFKDDLKPKNFDDFQLRTQYAKAQLKSIFNYMTDYKEIN